jgi:hypothetical protein
MTLFMIMKLICIPKIIVTFVDYLHKIKLPKFRKISLIYGEQAI